MQLKIVNCPDRDFKPYVERAALFFAKQLIPDGRLRNRCFTKIRFDAKIEEQGYCSVEGYNTRNEPREFLIEIHPGLGVRTILGVLAHEMVHVYEAVYYDKMTHGPTFFAFREDFHKAGLELSGNAGYDEDDFV